MNRGAARNPPLARTLLSTAGAADGSIIAAIITNHTAIKNPNEPSWVAVPMSIPCICQTAITQQAAARPSVPVNAAAVAAGEVCVSTAGSAGASVLSAGNAAFCGSTSIIASMINLVLLGLVDWGCGGLVGSPV